jgi:phage major head subunit gpT-like protein
MGAISQTFVAGFETRAEHVRENEYLRLTASDRMWWNKVATKRPSVTKKEIVTFLFQSAMIRDTGSGGNMSFEDLAGDYLEIESKFAGAGLRITKAQMTDVLGGVVGGEAFDIADEWNSAIGAYMAYWPQKQVAYALKNGHTAALFTGYDGKAFVATDHPLHPQDVARGTYKNLLTGGDAADISVAVTDAAALDNLAKVFNHIASIKMPNGEDPRGLRPLGIICGPKLALRVGGLLDAKFVAKDGGSGGGGADVSGYISRLGYQVIQADELAGYESDTTYFVVAEQATSSKVGALIYSEREPFQVRNYGPMTESELGRQNVFEWQCEGRNAVGCGHPYMLFKVKAA